MRNRTLVSAIALSLLVPGASVWALPSQPDHFCWMRDRWGRVVNLNSLCAGTVGTGAVESASVPVSTRPQKKATALTVENVKFTEPDKPGANYVLMTGDIVNKGSSKESVGSLNFDVTAMGKVKVSAAIDIDRTIPPGERTSFSVRIPKNEIGNVSMSALSLENYSIN